MFLCLTINDMLFRLFVHMLTLLYFDCIIEDERLQSHVGQCYRAHPLH